MNKQRIVNVIGFCFLILLLSGCQSKGVSKDADYFTVGNSEYRFQLPSGWKAEEEYQTVFNEAAVFGAVDTNSRAVLFIRGESSPLMNQKQLKDATDQKVNQHYDVKKGTVAEFKVKDFPAIHYLMPGVYDGKAVWLDMYFISTKTQLINIQCYRPKGSSAKQQQETLKKSVESLEQLSSGSQRESSSEEKKDTSKNGIQQIENEQLSIQITGYKIEKQHLIIRYVFTNKSQAELVPLTEWQKLITVTEAKQTLEPVTQLTTEDADLSYLMEQGQASLATEDIVESAVVYALTSETAELVIFSDQQKNNEPIEWVIER
ncbi:DUF5067 domain-containing protein [Enterococcus crotali]|uniref:DUF5067 domain-containing protein n=1 Tax=Enterococcus crotali TaxID=1453587 RepID=UPI0004702580|nr:DUF5067 domain-containing protein [Enterococcus crotali]